MKKHNVVYIVPMREGNSLIFKTCCCFFVCLYRPYEGGKCWRVRQRRWRALKFISSLWGREISLSWNYTWWVSFRLYRPYEGGKYNSHKITRFKKQIVYIVPMREGNIYSKCKCAICYAVYIVPMREGNLTITSYVEKL